MYIENNKLGCNVFQKPLVPVTLPVFLLVDRGDCYFVEKVCIAPPSVWLLQVRPLCSSLALVTQTSDHRWLIVFPSAAFCASPTPSRHCALLYQLNR